MKSNFENLILLVGTNPLPNYVVAKYFLTHNQNLKRIWLVYSELNDEIGQSSTQELADNIITVLQKEFNKVLDYRTVGLKNISSAQQISSDLEIKLIRQLLEGSKTVHLNYTGGTKAMAVHAYRYIEKTAGSSDTSFSYLDARDFKLKFDSTDLVSEDLKETINLSLANLMDLHGYEKFDKSNAGRLDALTFYAKPLMEISKLINAGLVDEFIDWTNKFLRPIFYTDKGFIDGKNKWLEHNKLKEKGKNEYFAKEIEDFKENFSAKTRAEFIQVLEAFEHIEGSLLTDTGQIWVPGPEVNNNGFIGIVSTIIKNFLGGKWLELYVEAIILRRLSNDSTLKDKSIPVASNWEIVSKSGSGDNCFELDVIVINGYQICGISCTTDYSKSKCKEKGFEILHRVNQIGGDEAKAILITGIKEGKNYIQITEDLKNITNTNENKLLVLGREDLAEDILWEKIRTHIWGE